MLLNDTVYCLSIFEIGVSSLNVLPLLPYPLLPLKIIVDVKNVYLRPCDFCASIDRFDCVLKGHMQRHATLLLLGKARRELAPGVLDAGPSPNSELVDVNLAMTV